MHRILIAFLILSGLSNNSCTKSTSVKVNSPVEFVDIRDTIRLYETQEYPGLVMEYDSVITKSVPRVDSLVEYLKLKRENDIFRGKTKVNCKWENYSLEK